MLSSVERDYEINAPSSMEEGEDDSEVEKGLRLS